METTVIMTNYQSPYGKYILFEIKGSQKHIGEIDRKDGKYVIFYGRVVIQSYLKHTDMNKRFNDTLEYLYDIIETARFFSDVREMTDFDITISPNGVDWGAYCSKPNNGGWFEEEDWIPRDGWPVYHLKTDSKEEIESVVEDYLMEHMN